MSFLFWLSNDQLLSCIFFEIFNSPCCLFASYSTTFSNWSNCWTPLTSITTPFPSLIDTLTSCRIDPNPLFTFFVLLKILPKDNAIFLISVESTSKGSVAISTNGTPKRSNPNFLVLPSSPKIFAASSSKQIDWIPIFISPAL